MFIKNRMLILVATVVLSLVTFTIHGQRVPENLNFVGSGHDDGTNYLILQVRTHGLANRMRVIADMSIIAAQTNRKLLFSWQPTIECNISFIDVFEEIGTSNVRLLPFILPYDGDDAASIISNMAAEHHLPFVKMDHEGFLMPHTVIADRSIRVVFTNYNGVVSLASTPCEVYTHQRSQFLSSLVPVPEIRHTVGEIMETHFSTTMMVGVHYRAHDKDFDWNVVPPLATDKAQSFGYGAGVAEFSRIMEAVQAHFAHQLVHTYKGGVKKKKAQGDSISNSGAGKGGGEGEEVELPVDQLSIRFFLASNDEGTKEQLIRQFPNLVALGPASGPGNGRSSSEGMTQAVIEWLLLSKAALIINTYGSSFAIEAAQINRTPLVGIWGGYYLYYNDPKMPYCGNLQFIKNYGKQGQDSTYTEGTSDNRQVEAKQIELRPCDVLAQWGLKDLLCVVSDEEANARFSD